MLPQHVPNASPLQEGGTGSPGAYLNPTVSSSAPCAGYGIGTIDLVAFCVVPALTLMAAFLAYFRPARALSGVDPMDILRSE